jgi:hypothetical protein
LLFVGAAGRLNQTAPIKARRKCQPEWFGWLMRSCEDNRYSTATSSGTRR